MFDNITTVNGSVKSVGCAWKAFGAISDAYRGLAPAHSQALSVQSLLRSVGRAAGRDQKTKPMRAITVRGCRKCVPLKVDRKLYKATWLVRLAMSTDAVNRSRFSV